MNPLAMMGGNNVMNQIAQLKQMMRGGNPNAMMQMFAQRNPQFAQFLRDNQGKSPEQVAKDYGLDWNQVQQMMK